MMDKILWAVISPLMWPVWALLFGLILARTRPRAARRVLFAGLACYAVIGLTNVGALLIRPLEQAYPRPVPLPERVAGIVMLTGGERLRISYETGLPEFRDPSERATAALMLARRYPQSQVIVVGGVARGGTSDLKVVRQFMVGTGADMRRVRFVGGTRDTCGNAAGARAVAGLGRQSENGSWLLVTSANHMPRAMACFRAQGLTMRAFPVDYRVAPSLSWRDALDGDIADNIAILRTALYEWAGLFSYWLGGRIAWPLPLSGPAATPA